MKSKKGKKKVNKRIEFDKVLLLVFIISVISSALIIAWAKVYQVKTSEAETGSSCDVTVVDGISNNALKVSDDGRSISTRLIVTGSNRNCDRYATIAVWKLRNSTGLPLSSQEFYSSNTDHIQRTGTYNLSASLPACGYWQADLLGQQRPTSINGDANYQIPQDILVNYKLGGTPCSTPHRHRTTPTPTPAPTPTPNPTPEEDVCPNIEGMQEDVPDGYFINDDGDCVVITGEEDVCPNIEGMQEDVPDGYFINDDGDCVSESEEEEVDVCPNIEGMQEDVPDGYTRDADGNCIILKPTGKLESPKVLPNTGIGSTALTISVISAIVSGFGYYYVQKRKITN